MFVRPSVSPTSRSQLEAVLARGEIEISTGRLPLARFMTSDRCPRASDAQVDCACNGIPCEMCSVGLSRVDVAFVGARHFGCFSGRPFDCRLCKTSLLFDLQCNLLLSDTRTSARRRRQA